MLTCALGVLCCFALFVCLTLLASFFLPSHLSFKNMYMWGKYCLIEVFDMVNSGGSNPQSDVLIIILRSV